MVLWMFPPRENGLPQRGVDIGGSQVAKAFMVAPCVVIGDELGKTRLQLPRQVIVLEQDLVLHGTVVALLHTSSEPFGQTSDRRLA
jgi:hypothetical protein